MRGICIGVAVLCGLVAVAPRQGKDIEWSSVVLALIAGLFAAIALQ